jgi:hypothetical protein
LTTVEQALKLKVYEESVVPPLLSKLESYQKSNSIAYQAVNKQEQKVTNAVTHLQKLKAEQKASVQEDKS